MTQNPQFLGLYVLVQHKTWCIIEHDDTTINNSSFIEINTFFQSDESDWLNIIVTM